MPGYGMSTCDAGIKISPTSQMKGTKVQRSWAVHLRSHSRLTENPTFNGRAYMHERKLYTTVSSPAGRLWKGILAFLRLRFFN